MAKLKKLLKEGKVTFGTWVSIPHVDVIEALATLPFDWLLFDMEHGPLDISILETLIVGVKGTEVTPFVRVPWNDKVMIKRVLDIGFKGVMVPWVNSREEAEYVVKSSRYPPRGFRGFGPRRAVMYGAESDLEYYKRFENEELVIAVQIESEDAVKNVEEIANVDGVDILFIGPADLSISLGIPLQYEHPKLSEAMQKVLNACKKYDKTPGIQAFNLEQAKKYYSMGFRFLGLMSDIAMLRKAYISVLAEFKEIKEEKYVSAI